MSNSLLINLSFLTPEPTGIGTYAANLFPQLQQLEPTLLASQQIENYTCYHIPETLTPNRGPKGQINRLLWTQFELPTIYQKLQSTLMFSPIPEAPLYSGCRYIVTVHDLIPLRFPRRFSRLTAYFRYYIPQVLRQAEHIICDSQATAIDVAKFFQIPGHKMTAIPLACDNINFRYLDLPTKNYFLYTGRHDPYKNLERLIAAFASLPDRANYELWLAGPPNAYTPQLTAQVEELGLQSLVKFLGYVSLFSIAHTDESGDRPSFPYTLGRIRLTNFRSNGLRHTRHHIQLVIDARSSRRCRIISQSLQRRRNSRSHANSSHRFKSAIEFKNC